MASDTSTVVETTVVETTVVKTTVTTTDNRFCTNEGLPIERDIEAKGSEPKKNASIIVAMETEDDIALSELLSVVTIASETTNDSMKQPPSRPQSKQDENARSVNIRVDECALSLSSSGSKKPQSKQDENARSVNIRVDECALSLSSSGSKKNKRNRNCLVGHQQRSILRRSSMGLGDSAKSGSSAKGGSSTKGDQLNESLVSGSASAIPESLKRVESTASIVSFQSVNVREYDRTIGDNPSCSSGIPISLDWSHSSEVIHKVDDYEKLKYMKNTKYVTRITPQRRESLVKMNLGYSDEEIALYMKETKKVQRSRSMTDLVSPFWRIQHAYQSASRKVHRKLKKRQTTPQSAHAAAVDNAILTSSSSYHSFELDRSKEYTINIDGNTSCPKRRSRKKNDMFRKDADSQQLDESIGSSRSSGHIEESLEF